MVYPKTYIITTAQKGKEPFGEFLDALESKRKKCNGEIIILPTNGKDEDDRLDAYLRYNFRVETRDRVNLNSNCFIMQNPTVKAQAVNPLQGMSRHVPIGKMAIIPSPKLMMKTYSDENDNIPKTLISTGAVTLPNYADNRSGEVAELDHTYSAIVVDVVDNQDFHYRQLNADRRGVFYDLAYKYGLNQEPIKRRLEAMVLADWHEDYTAPKVIKATARMFNDFQPKRVFIHDLFDGDAISFFHKDDVLLKARQAMAHTNSLKDALYHCWERLNWFKKHCPEDCEIYIVKSNHDERLDRYLQEARFKEDPINAEVGMILAGQILKKQMDPLIAGIKEYGGKIPPGITFLDRGSKLRIGGWMLSVHGDKGPNGRRSSTTTLESGYDWIIPGHGHYPEIFRKCWRVGTSTPPILEYNRGSTSNWMNTHALLPGNYHPQLVNIVKGEYKP